MQVDEVAGLIEDRMRSRYLTLEQAAESLRTIIKDDRLVDAATAQIKKTIGEIEDLRDPDTVSKRRFVPWYTGPGQSDFFWPRLKKYLVEEKGWDEATVESIDQSSTKVISQLPCPALAEFDGRGLVLGYVQSGKTANFTAVVSKAADVGFRLIVILSGLTNSLRRQTQERMEADLIERAPARWVQWTNAAMDIGDLPFSAEAMLSQSQSRNLAVVKKNPHRLRRLLRMLKNTSPVVLRSAPILIIDDECDQASVNSARLVQDRTTINKLLVDLLALVPKAAYVGYTATPYANVLVDPTLPEDLYPRDFVISLPRPEGYFGAERLFGRRQIESDVDDRDIDDGLDMIRCIPANEEAQLRPTRAQKDDWAMPITPAVADAIRYFLLASAARRVRPDLQRHQSLESKLTSLRSASSSLHSESGEDQQPGASGGRSRIEALASHRSNEHKCRCQRYGRAAGTGDRRLESVGSGPARPEVVNTERSIADTGTVYSGSGGLRSSHDSISSRSGWVGATSSSLR